MNIILTFFVLCCSIHALPFSVYDCCLQSFHPCFESFLQNEEMLVTKATYTMVTYYTHHIIDHAYYTFAINSLYAKYHDANLLMLSPSTGHEFDTNDQRWNKVKIILDMLEQCSNFENQQYLIWLDADLIFVDFSFDLTAIIQKFPLTDIIISREINPKNGIANTGTIIVKCSVWSRWFFSKWWNDFDRSAGMDQHAFERLYVQSAITSHITLLPDNAINSRFPGLVTYQDQEPILHVAGESNFIRKHIFKVAWENLCYQSAATTTVALTDGPPPLITREILDTIDYVVLHEEEWKALQLLIAGLVVDCENIPVTLRSLDELRYKVREAQQSISKFVCQKDDNEDNDATKVPKMKEKTRQQFILDTSIEEPHRQLMSKCLDLTQLFYKDRIRALQAIYEKFVFLRESCSFPYSSAAEKVLTLQGILDSALDFAIVETKGEGYLSSMFEFLQITIEELKQLVHPSQWKIVLYYNFKIHEMLALYYDLTKHDLPTASMYYLQTFHIWQEMVERYDYFGDGNGLMNSYEEGLRILRRYFYTTCWQLGSIVNEIELKHLHFYTIRYYQHQYGVDSNWQDTSSQSMELLVQVMINQQSTVQNQLLGNLVEVLLLSAKCKNIRLDSIQQESELLEKICVSPTSSVCTLEMKKGLITINANGFDQGSSTIQPGVHDISFLLHDTLKSSLGSSSANSVIHADNKKFKRLKKKRMKE